MTYVRQWPLGLSDGQPASGAALTAIDQALANTVDGLAGGKVAPAAPINFAGAGIAPTGPVNVGKAPWFFAVSNWKERIDLTVGVNFRIRDIAALRSGIVLGVSNHASNEAVLSLNDGQSWIDFSTVVAAAVDSTASGTPYTPVIECCDSFPGGNMLACGTSSMSRILFSTNTNLGFSSTFKVTDFMASTPTVISKILYSTTHNLWVAVGKTASAPWIATSPTTLTFTSWTIRTPPASITGSINAVSLAEGGGGRFVATWAGATRTAYSDDGVTWTASANTVTAGSYNVVWDPNNLVWMLADGSNNVYVSADGSTWTTVGLGTRAINWAKLISVNGLIVGASNTDLEFTLDGGASFFRMSREYASGGVETLDSLKFADGRVWLWAKDGSLSRPSIHRSLRLGLWDGSH